MTVSKAPGNGPSAWSFVGGFLALALSGALLWRVAEAHGVNAELFRERVRAEQSLERLKAAQTELRARLRALSEDPQYVEAKLRRWETGEKREAILERRVQTPKVSQ